MEQRKYETRKKSHTDQGVANIGKAPKGQRKEITDALEKGLVLRINDQGAKSWMLSYRVSGEGGTSPTGRKLQGRTRKMPLGPFPSLSVKAARLKAQEMKEKARNGEDPNIARQAAIQSRRNDEALTFRVMAERYLEDAKVGKKVGKTPSLKPDTVKNRRGRLHRLVLPVLGDRPLADITYDEVDLLISKLQKTAAVTVPNDTLEDINGVFNYAKTKRLIKENPALSLSVPSGTEERDRVLRYSELRDLWDASGRLGNYGKVLPVLALTG